MLSVTSQYALRAMVALAGLPEGELCSAAGLALQTGVPANYLGKLLKQLAQARLLVSQKGLGGGFRLARPAQQISLLEIVSPLENIQRIAGCLLGPGVCDASAPCPAHGRFKGVRDVLQRFLEETTLAELAGLPPPTRPRRRAAAPRG